MIHALQCLFACALCLCMSAQQSEPAAPAANSAPPTPRFAPCAGLAASSSLAVCPPSARRSAPCFWLLVAHATKELN